MDKNMNNERGLELVTSLSSDYRTNTKKNPKKLVITASDEVI